ncbi:MAG: ATP-binding protein [Myxococcaceae bacterium]
MRRHAMVVGEGLTAPGGLSESLQTSGVTLELGSFEEALARVSEGTLAVCLLPLGTENRALAERLKEAGAAIVWLGPRDQSGSFELPSDEHALVSAIARAFERLEGLKAPPTDQINRFAQAIATQFALPDVIRVAIGRTRELVEADGATLLLVNKDGRLYFDTIDGGAGDGLKQGHLVDERLIASSVATRAAPRLVADVSEADDFDRSSDERTGFSTGSIVAAPLVVAGDVLGVLMAVRSKTSPPFSPVHLERLVQLAPHVAIAVQNAQTTSALRASQAEVLKAYESLEHKVTERTAQLSRAKKEWESTFDAISEPIAIIEGHVLKRVNLAYAKRAGLPVRDIPGKKCHEVLAGRSTPCPGCPLTERVGSGGAAELNFDKVGTFKITPYTLSDDPNDHQVVVHYQDVTQARALEQKLRETERLQMVGQLASGAAHEINNPIGFVTSNLNSLRGLLEELGPALEALGKAQKALEAGRRQEAIDALKPLDPLDPHALDDAMEMVEESLHGAKRVGDIVRGLRELSRLEITRSEAADVNAAVSRVARAQLGENPDVVLELKATHTADIAPLQLDQALLHVLTNAKQAVKPGQRVSIRTFERDREVVVQVQDEGAGIRQEHLSRVFEPFFTTRGVGKGIGLGLTAAWGLVRRAGGMIEVESAGVGHGAKVTLRLPIAEEPEVAAPLH